jgi:hypothetical protein
MVAVFEEALRTFCGCAGSPGRRNQRLFREAAEWFDSSDTSWPFAFEFICDALGLEPEWIRQLLRRWEARRTAGTQQPARIPTTRRLAGTCHAVTGRAPGLRHPLRFASSSPDADVPSLVSRSRLLPRTSTSAEGRDIADDAIRTVRR